MISVSSNQHIFAKKQSVMVEMENCCHFYVFVCRMNFLKKVRKKSFDLKHKKERVIKKLGSVECGKECS